MKTAIGQQNSIRLGQVKYYIVIQNGICRFVRETRILSSENALGTAFWIFLPRFSDKDELYIIHSALRDKYNEIRVGLIN